MAKKKKKTPKYSVLLQWSDEVPGYVIIFPDWEGRVGMPFTHGPTLKKAAKKAKAALENLVKFEQDEGKSLPEPHLWTSAD